MNDLLSSRSLSLPFHASFAAIGALVCMTMTAILRRFFHKGPELLAG